MIDTHVHVWNFDRAEYSWLKGDTSLLNRSYFIEELEEERIAAGVTGGVLVQAANNFEDTDSMLEVARSTPWIRGVVGWLPLTDPDATGRALEQYRKDPFFKGVRHLIHDEPDPQWLLQDTVLESLGLLAQQGIPYDVVGVLPAHLETVLRLAHQVPALQMILDHLNQPPISGREKFGRWGELMKEAAQHEKIWAKISGLGTASRNGAKWTAAGLEPYISFTLQHFGTDRCCCGGDWPVALLAGSYSRTWEAYKTILKKLLNEEGQNKVFSLNAEKLYSL